MAWNIRTSRQFSPDLEILVHQVNVDVAPSIVLDASTFPVNSAGERELKAGTPLVKNSNNQYQAYASGGSLIVQKVVVDGTGGTFVLIHGGQSTSALDWDSTAAEVKAALEALSTISAGGVEVSRTEQLTGSTHVSYTYEVTFTVPTEAGAITATDSLTGGAGTVTITSTLSSIMGILSRTEKVPDTLSHSDIPSAMWNHGQWFRSDRIVGWASDSTAIKAALPTCKFS